MKFEMRPVGAGGLIWFMATACGETTSDSDSTVPSDGSGGTASSGGSAGHSTATGTAHTSTGGTQGTSTGTGGVSAGGTSSGSCPDIEPSARTRCADEGLSCTFTNCVAPEFRDGHTLTCRQGAWELGDEVECLANCPDTAPNVGSSCDAAATPGPCPVENACGVSSGFCVEGEWALETPDAKVPAGTGGGAGLVAASCPEVMPAAGDDCCPETELICDYSSGQGMPLPPSDGAQGGAGSIGTTGTTGGTGGTGDSGTGSEDARPGVQGAVGTTGSMGATGGTGGTGAPPWCLECDIESRQWRYSSACY